MAQEVDIRVLGPVGATLGGEEIALGGPKQRAVLAMLALSPNRTVSMERIIDGVWGEDPPNRAVATVQVYVSGLRKALTAAGPKGQDLILTKSPGYRLDAEAAWIDAARFERLTQEALVAQGGGDHGAARRLASDALDEWMSDALDGLRDVPFAQATVPRLEEQRHALEELRVDAELALGNHGTVVGELERLVAEQPLRERRWMQMMTALYRAGRQADALHAYERARELFLEELGVDPSPAMRELEHAILTQDESLDSPQAIDTTSAPLPHPVTPLIGRDSDILAVTGLLSDPAVRIVTLTGIGGIGKTRLAVASAALLAEHGDAVAFVDLANARSREDVLLAIAKSLGVEIGSAEEALAKVAAAMNASVSLLLLDNFEQAIDTAELVASLAAEANAVTQLVTCRMPLRVSGEHEFRVPPLRFSDVEDAAIELFIERAAAAGYESLGSSREVIRAICARLDGLPLAIELAAATARLLTPEEIVERIEQDDVPAGAAKRDSPKRHQSIDAVIRGTWDLLPAVVRRLLAGLSVFVGGFTLEAGEAVFHDIDVTDGLLTLLDHGLLQREEHRGETRFRLLETVQSFAADQLDDDQRQGRSASLFAYVSALVEAAETGLYGPDSGRWEGRMVAEHENIDASLAWAASHGKLDEAAETAGLAAIFWRDQGLTWYGTQTLQALLGLEPRRAASRGRLLYGLGLMAARADATDVAEARFAAALEELPRDSHALDVGWCLYELGNLRFRRGNYEDSLQVANEVLEIAQSLEDRGLEEGGLLLKVNVAHETGDHDAERAGHVAMRDRAIADGDELHAANAEIGLAELALREGDIEWSRTIADRAIGVARQSGIRNLLMPALWVRAVGDLVAGRLGEARSGFLENARLAQDMGASVQSARACRGLGAVAAGAGDDELAIRLWGAAGAFSGDDYYEPRYFREAVDPFVEQTGSTIARSRKDQLHGQGATMSLAHVIEAAGAIPVEVLEDPEALKESIESAQSTKISPQ